MKEQRKITDKELARAIVFLDYFGVDYKGDTVYLTDGGNSCIVNMETQWKEFLGASINEVARVVANELGKEVKWK